MNGNDGNNNSDYFLGSCTHTLFENNPWWRVDLLDVYRISRIVITNRGDCCSQHLNGAEIRIGNSLTNNGNQNPKCGTITSVKQRMEFQCNSMTGHYVNVYLPGNNKPLYLCEVEVFGTLVATTLSQSTLNHKPTGRRFCLLYWVFLSMCLLVFCRMNLVLPLLLLCGLFCEGFCFYPGLKNVALRGKVTQSSVYSNEDGLHLGNAINGIEGNHNSNYFLGSCTHTAIENNPWWRVDLLDVYRISRIVITIEVMAVLNIWCGTVTSVKQTMEFQCNSMIARYVNVYLPGNQKYLHLCDVEVFGTLVGKP
nr:PREDICTED: uncharacterized protein LOC102356106 [Latimeria chalumnae]|eukprot:XP_014339530.1 PREDICTED: uncharacterized protein LOC102356106 [Latimeria chalumnae]